MLQSRLSTDRQIISLYDPACQHIDAARLREYETTRHIDDLGDLSVLPVKPTIFHCSPMLVKFQHLEDQSSLLFQFHVRKIDNCDDDWRKWDKKEDIEFLSDDALALIPREVVLEVGGVIRQLASVDGETSAFFPQAGWQERQRQSKSLAALLAARMATSAPSNDTESNETPAIAEEPRS